jgi:methionyl aminopeptidase
MNERSIKIHTPDDFQSMRKAGKLAAEVLDALTDFVKPGITTDEINSFGHEMIISAGAIPAPLGYRGFPKSLCTSINHVVCHGIPSDKKLAEGDIINIDVTVIVDGWHGDTSRMFYVGNIPIKAKRLTQVTYESMMIGIEKVKPGARLGDIGHAIQNYAEKAGFSVVREYCGHGLGKVFHDAPNVLHYGKPGTGVELKPGMFFTIEPMINAGKADTHLLADGWTVITRDRSLSAQFEHSIGVTETGYEIFTASPAGFNLPPYS